MQIHSRSALIAAGLALAGHFLITGNLLGGRDRAEEVWALLITALIVAPSLIALAAAFSSNATFRVAALTAAFVASSLPTLLLMAVLIGFFYVPGVLAFAVAAAKNGFAAGSVWRMLVSMTTGVIAGAGMLVAFAPMIGAYDSCRTTRVVQVTSNGHALTGCNGALDLLPVLAAIGIVVAAIYLIWVVSLFVGQPRKALVTA